MSSDSKNKIIRTAFFLLFISFVISLFFNFLYIQEKEVQERQYKTYLNHYYGIVNDSLQILTRLLNESQDEGHNNKELIVLSERLNRLAYMSSQVPYYVSDIGPSGINLFEYAANVIIHGGICEYRNKIPPFIEDNQLTEREKAYLEGIKDHVEYIHGELYSEETGQENSDLSKVEFNHITRYITRIMGEHDILLGCLENESTAIWEPSPTFVTDNMSSHGKKGKFGIIKVNGESDEPEFPVIGQDRLYQVKFLDDTKDFNEKKYKMMATHQDTGETVKLYEWNIESNQSGAKFGFDRVGLWRIDVSVDNEQYTSFIVEAKSEK